MRKTVLPFVIILSFAAFLYAAGTPKPAIVQKPGDWTADVRYTNPQQITLKTEDGKTVRFWYLIITVTNKTANELDFYPRCDVLTDTFQLIAAGSGAPDEVFNAIKQRHSSTYPFLDLLEKTSNKLLVGVDNAKDIAVIWPDFDPQAKEIKIFISGLSNEIAVMDHPSLKQADGNPAKVFLRKALELDYTLGGDPAFRSGITLEFKAKSWIMR
jgi:hypothetical protein